MTWRFRFPIKRIETVSGKVYVYRGRRKHTAGSRKGKVVDLREHMRRRRMQALLNPQDAA